jgi:hypothetical protein
MEDLLEELKELNLPTDQFAVFGSGPMAIRGIRKAGDLDLIVTQKLWDSLLAQGYPVTREMWKTTDVEGRVRDYPRELISVGNIEIWRKWSFLSDSADELIKDAEIFDDIRFVKLEKVIEWKKAFNRQKDKDDVKMIEDYLRSRS